MSLFCPKKWLRFFKAAHDEHRQKILEIIRKQKKVNASLIVRKMKLSQPTVSHHIKILHEAGLIRAQKKGKEVFYSLDEKGIADCCGGFMRRFCRSKY